MVEQRWLRTTNDARGTSLPAAYSPVIDEITESFFAAPLLSIDESVLRAFPVDPFDVARTRRRQAVSSSQAEQLVGGAPSSKRSALDELVAAPSVRMQLEPELSAPARYARPSDSDLAPPLAAPQVIIPAPARVPSGAAVAPASAEPARVLASTRPAQSGWLAGALIALAGIVVGGALVCAALTRNEAKVEPMPSPTVALAR